MASITAIILTRNEEKNLGECLKSIRGFVQRAVVVDCGSADRTVEIARECGADVLNHEFTYYAAQFNWAIDNANIDTDWILRLDADERLTPALIAEAETVLSSVIVMLTLVCASIWLGRNLQKRPGGKQVLTEKVVGMLYNMVRDTMGEHNLRFAPYIGALFCSSLLGTLISMLGFFRSATADISTTITWAIVTSVLVWYYNIKNNGFFGWLKGFTEPIVVMTPMNIVSEIAQPISMAFRHFGNVAGGSVLTMLIYNALAAASALILGWIPNAFINSIPILQVGIPAVLSLYFDLFSGFIQALVFSMLTMVYVGAACPPPAEKKAK